MSELADLKITRLGAQGDGVAETTAGPVYVPFTLPGECVRANVQGERAQLVTVLTASPARTTPACHHFTHCGGCALQHLEMPAYLQWKQELVARAFSARAIEAPIEPVVSVALGTRRRATFSARRTARGITLGFYEARGREIVNLDECPVTAPAIVQALPGLKCMIEPLLSRKGIARLVVTCAANGLDVCIEDVRGDLSPEVLEHVAREAMKLQLARVSLGEDTLYQGALPVICFGSANVALPPKAFLQAVPEAEAQMVTIVASALSGAKRVADLFCGLGTFTIPIANDASVLAVDGDRQAITALEEASKRTPGLKPVEVKVRDLFREPLSPRELNGVDAVVFDPPRAGAAAQSQSLAISKVKTVAAVSCNPGTLARDARILIDGGFRLESVTPIDQFLYSPHVEAVAIFRR